MNILSYPGTPPYFCSNLRQRIAALATCRVSDSLTSTRCNEPTSNRDAITYGNLKTGIFGMMINFNNQGLAAKIKSSGEPTVSCLRINIIREKKSPFFSDRLGGFFGSCVFS